MNAAARDRGAEVLRVPPPLLFAVPFVVGLLLENAAALRVGGRPTTTVAGGVVLAAGVGLDVAGVAAVVHHRTTIVPHHRVSRLLTGGPYRLTRNPMYTGLAVAYLGGALLAGTWWPLLALPLVLWTVRRLVIDPEERYLAAAFGADYASYRAGTRRWL